MKKLTLLTALFLILYTAQARQVYAICCPDDSLWNTFIPSGYEILDTLSCNLNLDAYEDKLLLVKSTSEKELIQQKANVPPRLLLILSGTASGSYTLAVQSSKALMCASCGGVAGDPYSGISSGKGEFSIEHYGGSTHRWARTLRFYYSTKLHNWFLKDDTLETFEVLNPEHSEKIIYTFNDFGKVDLGSFDIFQERE